MEDAKRWLRVIGVPCLFLVVGFGFGLLVHRALATPRRFVTNDTTGAGVAPDTKTGQYCNSLSAQVMGSKESP